jgi:NAD(P)-dependent dehydrogenase (short-subunit alcohol dehydrogenase family)
MGEKRFDVAGRVVIVTGGASGIGRVYCEALVAAGAKAVLADLDGELAAATAKALSADGSLTLGAGCDVSDAQSVQAMVDATVKKFGRIDGLVNNAALMSTLPRGPWHAIEESDWDRVMGVNLRGLFLCSRAVYPHMKKAGGGRIVNISSNRVWEGTPNRLHYTTSKAGVIGFTRALAREVGDHGQRHHAGLYRERNAGGRQRPGLHGAHGRPERAQGAQAHATARGPGRGAVVFVVGRERLHHRSDRQRRRRRDDALRNALSKNRQIDG